MVFFHFFAINLHVRFAFFYIGFAACSRRAIVLYVFRIFFANLQFPGRTSGKAWKIPKTLGNLQKKMQTICKKKQANTTKTRKKQHLFCILFANCLHFLQISQCFLYFSSIPRGPARKLQICEKKCKKMQKKNVLPGHAANPTRKKCRKNPNSKCKMNPPYKKMQTKAAKKNKNTPSPIPTRDALSWN